jgi:hypothetical protein
MAIRALLITTAILLWTTARADDAYEDTYAKALAQAKASADIAGPALDKIQRWLHEIALPKIDPKTGLYLADGAWNYRDTAADCLPYLVWAAWATDREALDGPIRQVLSAERRLCNVLDSIPAPYDFDTGKPKELSKPDLIFEASEYVKDGLVPIVEVLGKGPWFDRMREITDDIWKHADYETPYGMIPSDNVEVNGNHLQILARMYGMTRCDKYLIWSRRIVDFYLTDPNWVPSRLRDHGCEIIGGIGLWYAVELRSAGQSVAEDNYEKVLKNKYQPRIEKLYDEILARGTNPDGFMFNAIPDTPPADHNANLSDGWGYNYVGMLCYDMITHTERYKPYAQKALDNLSKPHFQSYPWEKNIDGYADSIEGALYLMKYIDSPAGTAWVTSEGTSKLLQGPLLDNGELWGTSKFQSNAIRTVLMLSMMHTENVTVRPWQQGLRIGTTHRYSVDGHGDVLTVYIRTDKPYEGTLEMLVRSEIFREESSKPENYPTQEYLPRKGSGAFFPRMNTFPNWLIYGGGEYLGSDELECDGCNLESGIPIKLKAGEELVIRLGWPLDC